MWLISCANLRLTGCADKTLLLSVAGKCFWLRCVFESVDPGVGDGRGLPSVLEATVNCAGGWGLRTLHLIQTP